MKNLIAAAFILVATLGFNIDTTAGILGADEARRIEISVKDLPQAVKQSLAKDQYKNLTAQSAWYVKDDSEFYQVELRKQDGSTTRVQFDKEGKKV